MAALQTLAEAHQRPNAFNPSRSLQGSSFAGVNDVERRASLTALLVSKFYAMICEALDICSEHPQNQTPKTARTTCPTKKPRACSPKKSRLATMLSRHHGVWQGASPLQHLRQQCDRGLPFTGLPLVELMADKADY